MLYHKECVITINSFHHISEGIVALKGEVSVICRGGAGRHQVVFHRLLIAVAYRHFVSFTHNNLGRDSASCNHSAVHRLDGEIIETLLARQLRRRICERGYCQWLGIEFFVKIKLTILFFNGIDIICNLISGW